MKQMTSISDNPDKGLISAAFEAAFGVLYMLDDRYRLG
jgi:23S rRNA maturation mini-RNase III